MARPLTRGRVIGFRLPLALDALLRDRAASLGMSPAGYVAVVVAQALQTQDGPVRAGASGRPARS